MMRNNLSLLSSQPNEQNHPFYLDIESERYIYIKVSHRLEDFKDMPTMMTPTQFFIKHIQILVASMVI